MDNKKRKILVVDDDDNFTKVIKMNLDATGRYEVVTENNSLNALSVVRSFMPDLIVLDIMMPDLDGTEIAFQIESDVKLKNIPIIFLTAAITKGEAASQKGEIGMHTFIAKPVDLEELIDCIENCH